MSEKKVGRPSVKNKKEIRYEIRFSDDEIKLLDKHIKKKKLRSRSELIRLAIKQYLKT